MKSTKLPLITVLLVTSLLQLAAEYHVYHQQIMTKVIIYDSREVEELPESQITQKCPRLASVPSAVLSLSTE